MAREIEGRLWLDAFEEYTDVLSTPDIFRKWGGITMVAAALERRVWITTSVKVLYPNLYVIFVGPPGVGKGIMATVIGETMRQLKEHKLASSSITRATVVEELNEAERFFQYEGVALQYNALYIVSHELGVLLPAYDMELLNKLTDIYDCGRYSERRRKKEHNVAIERPVVNIFGAVTPGYFGAMIPEVAWEQGFFSRTILIYSGQLKRKSLWDFQKLDTGLWHKLVTDLRAIGRMKGEFRFTPEAAKLIDNFHMEAFKTTELRHPKMQHYNTRRPAHLLKLMMVSSAMRHDDMVIDVEDFQTAFDWLVEAEDTMPEIFKAMSTGGDSKVIQEAWHFVYEVNAREGRNANEDELWEFMSNRVPADKAKNIIEIMKNAKLLIAEGPIGLQSFRANGEPRIR